MVKLSQWDSSLELYANKGFVYKIDQRSGKQEELAKILFSFSSLKLRGQLFQSGLTIGGQVLASLLFALF